MLAGSPQRYRRRCRLLQPAEFKHVFAEPQRSATSSLTVLIRSSGHDRPRLGLVVARKTASSAVARNRVKRLVRESFRRHRVMLPAVDLVVIARPGITKKTNRELFAELEIHWSRLARWKVSSQR